MLSAENNGFAEISLQVKVMHVVFNITQGRFMHCY